MAMTLTTWRSDGRPIITALGKGGVFVETVTRNQGQGAGYFTYSNLVGHTLRIVQITGGSYTWSTGVDAWGQPYLALNPLPPTVHGSLTRLLVFAQ